MRSIFLFKISPKYINFGCFKKLVEQNIYAWVDNVIVNMHKLQSIQNFGERVVWWYRSVLDVKVEQGKLQIPYDGVDVAV